MEGYQSLKHGILYSSVSFTGGKPVERFSLRFGGPGPVPGTSEARRKGCMCPGKREGQQNEGWYVSELCPLHGREAINRAARRRLKELKKELIR